MDYIDNHLREDIEIANVKIFPEKDLLLAFDYVVDFEELISDFLTYMAFTPYRDTNVKMIYKLIDLYPDNGYEIDFAATLIDEKPQKSIELINLAEDKYSSNEIIKKRIKIIKIFLKN